MSHICHIFVIFIITQSRLILLGLEQHHSGNTKNTTQWAVCSTSHLLFISGEGFHWSFRLSLASTATSMSHLCCTSQPKHQSFNSATSWNLSAPTFCSAAITGACCRAKIAIMYNHQVILCPSTPNHLTKSKNLVQEWSEIPSAIVPTEQLASGSFGSSGSATESACDGIRIWWKELKIDLILLH